MVSLEAVIFLKLSNPQSNSVRVSVKRILESEQLKTTQIRRISFFSAKVTRFYRNQQAKAIVFKGNLPRYGELPELLKVLENSSEVHFSLKGNTLIVE